MFCCVGTSLFVMLLRNYIFSLIFRAEGVEKSQMLMTKAMREKEQQRELRRYRYALIRVRFPDGILLQVKLQ